MNNFICHIPAGTPVLVTGATGFTGSLLTRKLVGAGMKVSAISRPQSDLSPFENMQITWFQGDIGNAHFIREAVSGQEYVFHLASAYRNSGATAHEHWQIHVRSTQLICETARLNPRFKRYVHISTVGVHGNIEHPPADENYRFSPGDAYQRTKLQAEEWLRIFSTDHEFPFTIIRPAAIYGPGDRRLLKLFRLALNPAFFLLGNGKCMYHLIHVDDLTNAIVLASAHKNAIGETFIVAANDPVAVEEIASTVATAASRKSRPIRLPAWPFLALAAITEQICAIFGVSPPITTRRVKFFLNDRHFKPEKMRRILGYNPTYDNATGIRETLNWYIHQGWIK
jgi:nucleoside-diphosphate-sugar epimerase